MTINQNPKCFLDVAIDGQPVGRIIVELFADVCPRTCENFRLLCTGEMGTSKLSGRKLYYKGSCFHRIVKGFMVQGGDFEKGDGTGGESIYGLKFEDENFELRHDRPGLLSMANKGANSNGSQFFITTVPAPHIDGKNVVFGSVIHGFEVVKMIEKVETVGNFHPKVPIQISGCGELIAVIKKSEKKKKSESSSEESSSSSSSEEESSSESESEKKKKKRKKKNKKHAKKKRKVSSEKNSKKEEEEKEEETAPCGIDPAEIPSVPPNKFLYRGSPQQDKEVKDQPEEIENRQEAKPKSPMRRRDKTGRKIKGRGAVRYHSRSRSHSRGTTPPHWRREQSRLTTLSQALNSMKADRISRTGEEPKYESSFGTRDENRFATRDENRFATRDHNRFATGDEKRSRFDRRMNERPQEGLSERFAPERDSSTKFERKESLKSRLETDSNFDQKVAKRKRHDSPRSPVADSCSNVNSSNTERKKERRVEHVNRDRDVEKLTERNESPEERKKIAITPLATKSHQNKESPHKRSKTVKHDEYDPFLKNDKGSDSEAELKGNKVQPALQRCKEREPSHSTQKPSSQKDDFYDLEKRGNCNNVSKDESIKETVKESNEDVALKCKNVESKHKMKQSHSRFEEETSKHIEQKNSGFSPTRERPRTSRNLRRSHSREAHSRPKNARSDSRNEKLRGRMSKSRDERSASRERRMRSEHNESNVQRLPSGSKGRSPDRSRIRRDEPFKGRRQRSTSGSRMRNSRFASGNTPVRLRDRASRESLSNKTSKRDDEKCGRLAWQPPMEIEYETQGGNENVSASQVAGTAKPTDKHSFHEQVISDNPQTAPDTDLSEKSMSMSSSGDEKANGFGKEKVNAKKDEIHGGKSACKGSRSSSSDSSSESSSSERSKSLKRAPRDGRTRVNDYDDDHMKEKRKKLVKRHQRNESDSADSSSDDEEVVEEKSLKPQNLENVKGTECDINSIPLPLGSSECGLEIDFTHAPVLNEPWKLPNSQDAELSTAKSKSERNVGDEKCKRIEVKSDEMGTHSAAESNSRVKSAKGHASPRRCRSPGRSRSRRRERRSRSTRRNKSFRRRSRSGMRDRSLRRSRSNRRNRSRRSRSRGWERTRRSRSLRRDRSRRSRSARRDRSRRSRSVRKDRSCRDRGRERSRSSSTSVGRKEVPRRRGRSTRSRSSSSETSVKRGSPSRKLSRGKRSNDRRSSSSSSSSSS